MLAPIIQNLDEIEEESDFKNIAVLQFTSLRDALTVYKRSHLARGVTNRNTAAVNGKLAMVPADRSI